MSKVTVETPLLARDEIVVLARVRDGEWIRVRGRAEHAFDKWHILSHSRLGIGAHSYKREACAEKFQALVAGLAQWYARHGIPSDWTAQPHESLGVVYDIDSLGE